MKTTTVADCGHRVCGVRLVSYLGRPAMLLVSSTNQVASSWILILAFCDVETSRVKACSSVRRSRCIKIPLAIPMLSRELRAVCHSVCWVESDQCDRGVRGEQLPDDFSLGVERVQFRGIQIQGAQSSTIGKEPIAEHRLDTLNLRGGGEAGPPSVD